MVTTAPASAKPAQQSTQPPAGQSRPPTSKQAINKALAVTIEAGIREPVRIISYRADPQGNILGRFSTSGQVFDYEINTKNEIRYNESKDVRADAFLAGVRSAGVRSAGVTFRFDGDRCVKGKACGAACIAEGLECKVAMPKELADKFGKVRSAIQQEGGQTATATPAKPTSEKIAPASAPAKEAPKKETPVKAKTSDTPAKADEQSAEKSPQTPIGKSQWSKALTVGGIGAGVTAAVLATAAVGVIANDVKKAGTDYGQYNFRVTEDGKPDEETLKTYDTFKPGDLIRKSIGVGGGKGFGGLRVEHYSVYMGKDPKTGEHMMVETNFGKDDKSRVDVQINPLTKEAEKGHSDYAKVPEEELKGKGKIYSREEIVKRSLAMVDKPFTYKGFTSSCEVFARGMVEGEAYDVQGKHITNFTRTASEIFTDTALKFGLDDGTDKQNDKRTIVKIGNKRLHWSGYKEDRKNKKAMTAQEMVEALKKMETSAKADSKERKDAADVAKPSNDDLLSASWDAVIDPKTEGLRSPEEFSDLVEQIAKKFPGSAPLVRKEMYKKYLMVLLSAMSGGPVEGEASTTAKKEQPRTDAADSAAAAPQSAIRKAIAAILEEGIRSPVNVASFALGKNDAIVGKFVTSSQSYDYSIGSDDVLEFNESEDVRNDAFVMGFRTVVASTRTDKGDQCVKGKACGDACIAEGKTCRIKITDPKAKAATATIRQRLKGDVGNVAADPAPEMIKEQKEPVKQVESSDLDPSVLINQEAKRKNLRTIGTLAGVTTLAIAGAGVAGIAVDLKRSQVEIDRSQIPPNDGIPDANTLAEYDKLEPGDLITKTFTAPGWGTRQHYGVYVGKDPETGEHMLVHATGSPKISDKIPTIVMQPLTKDANKNATAYRKVPPSEMHKRDGTIKMSGEEVVARAKSLIGTPFTYQGFDSNCESVARGIVEGKDYSTQRDKVTAFTQTISKAVIDTGLRFKVDTNAKADDSKEKDRIVRVGPFRIRHSDYQVYAKDRMTAAQAVEHLKKNPPKPKDRVDSADRVSDSVSRSEAFNATIDPATQELRSPEDYGALAEEFAVLYPSLADSIRVGMYKNYLMVLMTTLASKSPELPTPESMDKPMKTERKDSGEAQAQMILDLVLADRPDAFIAGAINLRTDAADGAPPGFTWVQDSRVEGGRYLRKKSHSKAIVAGAAVIGSAAVIGGAAKGILISNHLRSESKKEFQKQHDAASAAKNDPSEEETSKKPPSARSSGTRPKAATEATSRVNLENDSNSKDKTIDVKSKRVDSKDSAPAGHVWVKDSRVEGGRYLRKKRGGTALKVAGLIGGGIVTGGVLGAAVGARAILAGKIDADKEIRSKARSPQTPPNAAAKASVNLEHDEAVKGETIEVKSKRVDSKDAAPAGYVWVHDSRVKGGKYLRKSNGGVQGKGDKSWNAAKGRELQKQEEAEWEDEYGETPAEESRRRRRVAVGAGLFSVGVLGATALLAKNAHDKANRTDSKDAAPAGHVWVLDARVKGGKYLRKLKSKVDRLNKRVDSTDGAPPGHTWVNDRRVKGGRYLRKLDPNRPKKDDGDDSGSTPGNQRLNGAIAETIKRQSSSGGAIAAAIGIGGAIGVAGVGGALAGKWWADNKISATTAKAKAESEEELTRQESRIRKEEEAKTKKAVDTATAETTQKLSDEFETQKKDILSGESNPEQAAKLKQLESDHEEAKKRIVDMEQGQAKAIAATRKEIKKEFMTTYKSRTAQMEKDFEAKANDLKVKGEEEVARRTGEAASVIERNALQRIEVQRQEAVKSTQEQIQAERDKMAAGSTVKGALASNSKEGVAFATSVRRGLDLSVVTPANLEQRVTKAVGKLAQDRYSEELSGLSQPFKERAKEIREMPTRGSQKKWQAMEHALIAQGNREKSLAIAVDEIKAKSQENHQRLLRVFHAEVRSKGGHSDLLVKKADQAMTMLNRAMQKEIDEAVARVSQEHPLDKAFLGQKRTE